MPDITILGPEAHDEELYEVGAFAMKLRHTAALALVGWYLMLPPVSQDHSMGNVDAPLTEWKRTPTTYRDKAECEHVLDKHQRRVNAKNRQTALRFYKQAQCVSDDDSRLAK